MHSIMLQSMPIKPQPFFPLAKTKTQKSSSLSSPLLVSLRFTSKHSTTTDKQQRQVGADGRKVMPPFLMKRTDCVHALHLPPFGMIQSQGTALSAFAPTMHCDVIAWTKSPYICSALCIGMFPVHVKGPRSRLKSTSDSLSVLCKSNDLFGLSYLRR